MDFAVDLSSTLPTRDPVLALFPCLPGDVLEEQNQVDNYLQAAVVGDTLEYRPPPPEACVPLPEQLRTICSVPECLPSDFLDNSEPTATAAGAKPIGEVGGVGGERSILRPRNVLIQHCPNVPLSPRRQDRKGLPAEKVECQNKGAAGGKHLQKQKQVSRLPTPQKDEGSSSPSTTSQTFVVNMTGLRDIGMHICLTCGLSYKHRSGLSRHKSISHREVSYHCPHCRLVYTRPDSLKHHVQKAHRRKWPPSKKTYIKKTKN